MSIPGIPNRYPAGALVIFYNIKTKFFEITKWNTAKNIFSKKGSEPVEYTNKFY